MYSNQPMELRFAARGWFVETSVACKVQGVQALAAAWRAGHCKLDCHGHFDAAIPGRPAEPALVSPLEVHRRSMKTVEGRAALIHALTHIEFTAINLALDAVWRFPGMPDAFYVDWLQVAEEEVHHFSLLVSYLQSIGFRYGSFPAHNSLWEMADKTSSDILARMALVPVTMEARGLDAVPQLRAKFAQVGDGDVVDILDVILRDEIGHVASGNRWYRLVCLERGLDPAATYQLLARKYTAPAMHGPYNLDARREAGFTEAELASLGQ